MRQELLDAEARSIIETAQSGSIGDDYPQAARALLDSQVWQDFIIQLAISLEGCDKRTIQSALAIAMVAAMQYGMTVLSQPSGRCDA
ncbi:MAG: hypothetical protein ABFE07_24510 [Armatimonadia bacterium]|jgi:hypothetical protein